MEEIKKNELENSKEETSNSYFNPKAIITALILNWEWFVLSLIICVGIALVYLRYTTPVYNASARILIKNEQGRSRSLMSTSATSLGSVSMSNGIDNEIVILKSRSLAEDAIRDLKLYVTYMVKGRVRDVNLYKNQPISVDLDPIHLDKLNQTISITIKKEDNNYHIIGSYGNNGFDKSFTNMPAKVNTSLGLLSFTQNGILTMNDGDILYVSVVSPKSLSGLYGGALTASNLSEGSSSTDIVNISINDIIPQRAVDYLRQLSICYNRQANEDKNLIALRTEVFINGRLEKINSDLGNTEGDLQKYKQRNNIVSQKMNADQAFSNQDAYQQRLAEANTQIQLINSISGYMNQSGNRYQTLPSNVGLSDQTATTLISRYNDIALERNRLLKSASVNSPSVTPLTSQLDDLSNSISRAISQSRKNLEIQRNSVASQLNKYSGLTSQSPEQERILNQIGRKQEVTSGLYLMLLQKREENSISLAATADKGRLIDDPLPGGMVSPKKTYIMGGAVLIALAIPSLILFLISLLRYKIEGHEDVAKLTNLPILADVAVANEIAKTKADIVVHENKNNQMEEIFRSMRTNLQFMMKKEDKVVMFTSSTSGEGKTFNCANLAMSFALLDKRVIIVGLDIRKPRLAELFEINSHKQGITNLLVKDEPTKEEILSNIIPSGINKNLDLLLAGPIPPNPAELIARQSLEVIINSLKDNYDYIIIDTAPVGLVTDTLQIARIANATIYVCRADYTSKDSFNLINGLHNEKKLPNMSILINGIDMSKKKYGYYYGYGRYGKYGHYGRYGNKYGNYASYGNYGTYGNYKNSNYGNKNDDSIKQ